MFKPLHIASPTRSAIPLLKRSRRLEPPVTFAGPVYKQVARSRAHFLANLELFFEHSSELIHVVGKRGPPDDWHRLEANA